MVTSLPAPTDFTGRQRAALIKENAEALLARGDEIAMANVAAAEKVATTVIDLTTGAPVAPVLDARDFPSGEIEKAEKPGVAKARKATAIDTVSVVDVGLNEQYEVVQVIEKLENMTFGVGNHYTFEPGQKYKVTRELANHLRDKGYVLG